MMSLGFVLLLVSVVGLFVGPVVLSAGSSQGGVLSALNTFVVVSVGGLVLLHLIPEAWIHGGPSALIFVFIGVALPALVERALSEKAAALAPTLLLIGLMPHAALESTALGVSDTDHALGLGAAIAAHRLPVGLVLFTMWRRAYGQGFAWAALSALALATLVGFWAGDTIEALISETVMSWLQGFVGGALLHVAFAHHHEHGHTPDPNVNPKMLELGEPDVHVSGSHAVGLVTSTPRVLTRWSAAGGVFGVLVVITTLLLSPHH